jgi:hypothetical protein
MISSIKLFNNKVMGPVPKNSKIWDRSHVMRDRSHLDGTGTPRTYSAVHINPASLCTHVLVITATLEVWRPQLILAKKSTSRITFMNRVDQSELLKFPRTTSHQHTSTHCKLTTRSDVYFVYLRQKCHNYYKHNI